MNPLDALNPKIGDEELIRSYGNSITDLVTDNYTLSNVILDERIWSHKQYSDLMLLILGGCEESLADWDLAPKIVRELQEEVKRLRKRLEVIEDFINDELRAFVNSNTFDRIYDAIEKKLEVIE